MSRCYLHFKLSLYYFIMICCDRLLLLSAKVQQKSEKVTPFGGIFFVLDNQPYSEDIVLGIPE